MRRFTLPLLISKRKHAIRIRMKGRKLKGEFLLERISERGDNSWLLTKAKGKHATTRDVSRKDRSVVSSIIINTSNSRSIGDANLSSDY